MNIQRITNSLQWMFNTVHKGVRPRDIEAEGPIDLKIIWSIPSSHIKPRLRFKEIRVVVLLNGKVELADVMGRYLTRRICKKQEAAEIEAGPSQSM